MLPAIQLFDLLGDHTLRTVALGAGLVGLAAGVAGVFAVLRRQSLLGDVVSHSALPGIALAFLLTHNRNPLVLLIGAVIAGWLGTVISQQITRNSRIKQDAALGIVLSVMFGLGMLLLVVIQQNPLAGQAGLEKYLFGSAATLLRQDIIVSAAVGVICLGAIALFWKEFKLTAFDPTFAQSTGIPLRVVETVLASVTVLAICIGLQTVGVVLMSALLVAPAAAARQWTNRLETMALAAGVFGALSGMAGAVISSQAANLPAGPVVIVVLTCLVTLSIFFAPARGIFWEWLRHTAQHRLVEESAVLAGMLKLADEDPDPFRPHDVSALDAVGLHSAEKTMALLESKGWVKHSGSLWAFTEDGVNQARLQVGGGEATQ